MALAELVERLRPALLHPASNHLNGIAALAVGEAAGIPVVYEVRGFLEETWAAARDGDAQAADRYRLGREAETAVMAAAAAVVTLSESMRAEIVARGIPADRVVVVPNGVDIGRFAPRQPDQVLRSRLGLAEARPVVGYVSTLNAYEGVDLLVDAVARLAANGTAVSLLVVGDGPELPALRARAAALGLGGAAVFTGRVPAAEVPVYLSLLDLFVVPRRPDRVARLVTPLKPYEAMAMGCPLLVAGIEALTEIVGDGERGSTFPPGDARALAAAIAAILADPPPARARADEARAWVAAHRTWRRNAERYRELYARLGALGGGTGSSSGSGGGSPRRRTA